MNIGIIGGGMTGLTLAQILSQKSHKVMVFEKAAQLGGLATYQDYGAFTWDRFYHVILPSDSYLIAYLYEIGLGERIRWRPTLTGFYVDKKVYSLSNTLEFLRFPLLGPVDKARLAMTVLYCARLKRWQALEKITVEDWLLKFCGHRTFHKFWKPLLLAKLGENYHRVSAVFIWSYIKRAFSARDSSVQKEQLGHVQGGYKTVIDCLTGLILKMGGRLITNTEVRRVEAHPEGGILVQYDAAHERFDRVIFTSPVNVLQRVVSRNLVRVQDSGTKVEYLGVVCVVLVTHQPLLPYYVLNIAEPRIPFTGVIGMSNVVAPRETAGRYLTYLPKYVLSTDPLLRRPDDEVTAQFLAGLNRMFPTLAAGDIEAIYVNRAQKVQPLQVLDYSRIVPKVATQHKDFFVLNTSQFVNETLNNNSVLRHVNDFVARNAKAFAGTPDGQIYAGGRLVSA